MLIVTIVPRLSAGQICQHSNKIYVSISKKEKESDATIFWCSSLWGPTPPGALAIASSFIWVCIDCTMAQNGKVVIHTRPSSIWQTGGHWQILVHRSLAEFKYFCSFQGRLLRRMKQSRRLTLHFESKLRGVYSYIQRHNEADKTKVQCHCSRSCWRPDALAHGRRAEKKPLHSGQAGDANSLLLSCPNP